MSSSLLPVHIFTQFNKMEITNRMECLLNKQPNICMRYCEEVTKKTNGFEEKNTWMCYEKFSVPLNLYGEDKCRIIWKDIEKNAL